MAISEGGGAKYKKQQNTTNTQKSKILWGYQSEWNQNALNAKNHQNTKIQFALEGRTPP